MTGISMSAGAHDTSSDQIGRQAKRNSRIVNAIWQQLEAAPSRFLLQTPMRVQSFAPVDSVDQGSD
tara:strand:+ start:773 stop:970 length:198 start_codon:yes stop_codon:yes gene_type:complete